MRIRHWKMWKALPMRQGGLPVTSIKKADYWKKSDTQMGQRKPLPMMLTETWKPIPLPPGLSSKLGPAGNIVGGIANGLGTFVTEGLDRIDGYNYKNLDQIREDSIKSALLGVVCSFPGGLIQAGTLNENILEELMVNYTKRFGDQLNNFFGILDNFLLDMTMGGCYDE